MGFQLLRRNQRAVDRALLDGHYDAVLNTSTQRLDEFVGLMLETGLFDQLPLLQPSGRCGDVPEALLLRELAVLPLLDIPNIFQAERFLLQDAAVLHFLGFTVAQIQDGFPHRGRQGQARPHHRDLLYNLLKAISEPGLEAFRAAYVRHWAQARHARARTWAIDGTGVHGEFKLLLALNLGDGEELLGNWRLLPGDCGSELPGGRELFDELLEVLPATERPELLLVDGAYVDGAWMKRLKEEHGVDTVVRLRAGMNAFEDALQMVRADPSLWQTKHRSFTAGGTKCPRRYEIASVPSVSWDSYGGEIQVILIRPVGGGEAEIWALATTLMEADAWQVFRTYGKRWWLENRGNRELKEAYGLEEHLEVAGRTARSVLITLRLITYNLLQLFRRNQGAKLAARGLRTLRRSLWAGPRVLVLAGSEFGLYQIEEFAGLLGPGPKHRLYNRGP